MKPVLLHDATRLKTTVRDSCSASARRACVAGAATTRVAAPGDGDVTCGTPAVQPSVSQARIVGGVEAVPNSWPWHCLMSVLFVDSYYPWCGASIVADRYLLTAAHCL